MAREDWKHGSENEDPYGRYRGGKTARERQNGVHENRFNNRRERVAWQQDPKASNANFPSQTCNGKKNR
jgi:hypothetical protein